MTPEGLAADQSRICQDLVNLLRFIENLLAERDVVVFDIDTYQVRLAEADLCGVDGAPLPGVIFAPDEGVWLSFGRLRERPPPAPPPDLEPWLRREARPHPRQHPVLLPERLMRVPAEDASDLIEAGLVGIDEVAEADAGLWQVPLRPDVLPEVEAALASYAAGPWGDWAAEEKPRREAMRLYGILYKAHAEVAAGGEGNLELVVGIGLARWYHGGRRINVPLIEQRAEFELDENNGTLSITPRTVPPAPALAPFQALGIAGVTQLQHELTARLERIARDPELVFSPFEPASFHPILETCAARLDASGCVLEPAEELGPPGPTLRISPTLCVMVRPRREDALRSDLDRFRKAIDQCDVVIPKPVQGFVQPPPDTLPGLTSGLTCGGWGHSSGSLPDECETGLPRSTRMFFPLPWNAEQAEIANRLEQPDVHGVVVQGPPGTGKTHTIANIIGHWMATGRRVLVAAHTAEALTAVREKLPEPLRDLVVAVTHSDREGARQLEDAVSALANRVQTLNVRESRQRAADLLESVGRIEARLAANDSELANIARANLTKVAWRGGDALAQEIAAWVASQGERHTWFPDTLDLTPVFEPRFGDAEADELRALRGRLGSDLCYRAQDVPAVAELPTIGSIIAAHHALRDAGERIEREREGDLPRPDFSQATPGGPAALLQWLERLGGWRDSCGEHTWLYAVWQTLGGETPARLGIEVLRPMLEQAARLAEQGTALTLLALELPDIAEVDRLGDALANLAAGRRAFGPFAGLRRSPVREAVESARIAGERPNDVSAWCKLAELHAWRRELRGFTARWNAFAAEHGLKSLPADHAPEALQRLGRPAAEMLVLAADAHVHHGRLKALFPYGIEVDAVMWRIDLTVVTAALRANLGAAGLADAERLRDELRTKGQRAGKPLAEALCQVADGLGSSSTTDAELAMFWEQIRAEVDRLTRLRPELERRSVLAALVRDSGAVRWAGRLETEPATAEDPLMPTDWRDAWDHARAKRFISRVADRGRVLRLTEERADLIQRRERDFLAVIELRTHLGLAQRLTATVQAALRQFLAALSRMPKSASARTAPRQRRILRDSLQRAVRAIPCWVMPEWRVAEQLPAEPGAFDLVIIDEASQSNILALPVLLRGAKVLIVGDDKQVSPVAIGIEEAVVSRLRATYLAGQWLADQIDPATSLYELCGMAFPTEAVMLREHFRCVEPIIRFSSRFYGGHLLPLRVPEPSKRIDPPLVDILVEDGRRSGDVNQAEAEIIVEEIRRCVADSALNASGKRSIGVISLHAAKQSKLIYDRLMAAVGPEMMTTHRIMCGDAATFQGQERDIVFLSMVHDARTASRQSSRIYEQRYNVALSRARDRLVLVRSVTESALKDGDIKLAVLRHFQNPMETGTIAQSSDVLAACESQFERAVGGQLLAAGYRLRAQVPAGGYRIDFVVEGEGDRRLAIELDGDSFHGPDRWADDVRRQKALERFGWIFWRCWASEWEADQAATFRDLRAALDRMGIAAIGAAADSVAPPVEFRIVRRAAPLADTATEPVLAPEEATSGQPLLSKAPPSDRTVRVGDEVVVRYADGSARALTVAIIGNGSVDGRHRIAPSAPLAKAILGLRIEDEAEVMIDGRRRTLFVEAIREAA